MTKLYFPINCSANSVSKKFAAYIEAEKWLRNKHSLTILSLSGLALFCKNDMQKMHSKGKKS